MGKEREEKRELPDPAPPRLALPLRGETPTDLTEGWDDAMKMSSRSGKELKLSSKKPHSSFLLKCSNVS